MLRDRKGCGMQDDKVGMLQLGAESVCHASAGAPWLCSSSRRLAGSAVGGPVGALTVGAAQAWDPVTWQVVLSAAITSQERSLVQHRAAPKQGASRSLLGAYELKTASRRPACLQ